jgi:hypothetical protein
MVVVVVVKGERYQLREREREKLINNFLILNFIFNLFKHTK